MDPLTKGHYPLIMKQILKERLPRFTAIEALLVKGSYDFIGVKKKKKKILLESTIT